MLKVPLLLLALVITKPMPPSVTTQLAPPVITEKYVQPIINSSPDYIADTIAIIAVLVSLASYRLAFISRNDSQKAQSELNQHNARIADLQGGLVKANQGLHEIEAKRVEREKFITNHAELRAVCQDNPDLRQHIASNLIISNVGKAPAKFIHIAVDGATIGQPELGVAMVDNKPIRAQNYTGTNSEQRKNLAFPNLCHIPELGADAEFVYRICWRDQSGDREERYIEIVWEDDAGPYWSWKTTLSKPFKS